ncbi:cell wall hydrolase [Anaerovorax sp. IOR16]|uniref:cell wall hydrolase n=1 Tax=Anaerovorax sp. IOR16 TaxID=2773458 RepID=UPI0019D299D1|nr:cell wall hydrolase [Anaerovorax sp. IOR16]
MEERARRRKRQRVIKDITSIVLKIILAFALLTIISNQNAAAQMQTNTLNKLNDLSVEIDDIGTITPSPEEDKPTVGLSDEERELIEKVVMAEAEGEPIEGKMAVAQAIKDRSELWDMTVTEVVLQPAQFTKPSQKTVNSEVIQAVSAVFDSDISIFDDPVTHFHNDSVSPYWIDGKINRGSIGGHTFYY